MSDLGIVIIGRNEGERLIRCLASLVGRGAVVYVDSGSTDGSPEAARAAGAVVVDLDRSIPFTAARARNQGFQKLLEIVPDARYVQFVDGDCEIAPGWLDAAQQTMDERPELAAICGRLRERFPERSIYNRLCDMEWNGPIGEINACGGIAMHRVAAFSVMDGFNPRIVAGEEPELCLRLRRSGWKILRLSNEMASHDAAMSSFRQWWRRAVRAGHAYAEGAAMHGRSPERHNVRQIRSALFWGLVLPLLIACSLLVGTWSRLALLALPGLLGLVALWLARIWRGRVRAGDTPRAAARYAVFVPPAKLAHCCGAAKYWLNRFRGRVPQLIEYKTPGPAPTA